MKAPLPQIVLALLWGTLVAGIDAAWAAKAPVSPERLRTEADHIVSGRVVDVTSKTEKSTVERALGFHRDRIFRITVVVETVAKGIGIDAGNEIEVVAWQPARRIPSLPGLQGHLNIPKTGDLVTVFLKDKDERIFEPILPNGIKIEKAAAP